MGEDWKKELEERKKEYNTSGRGNKPVDNDKFAQDLADSMKTELKKQYQTDLNIAYTDISFGTNIEAEQVFQQELHEIVDDMKVKLVNEKKILEGTLNPEYGKGEWVMPFIERTITENELSNSKPTKEQWKSDSPNGSLITDLTHVSTQESNNSACIAELFNRGCPIAQSDDVSTPSSTHSCSGKSDDCGIVIDATNESSECTVPMISGAMLGTPNEVRWSPRLRSMESSVPSLLDVRS
jgi:hypothetical protein